MGSRNRKVGCTCHVPICSVFGVDNPFNKIQAQRSCNRMTQDNVSLRKGMSSQTSYASIARAVEEKHRRAGDDHPVIQKHRQLVEDDTPRDGAPPPKLYEDLFGCSPRAPKLISGFSGHRPHNAFVVGQSVNQHNLAEWRAHAATKEVVEHKAHHHYRHLTTEEAAQVRAEAANGTALRQGGMVLSLPNRATAGKRPN